MIPYLAVPPIRMGPLTLHAFGVFVALALMVGYWVTVRRAERRGVPPVLARIITGGFLVAAMAGSGVLTPLLYGSPGISSFTGIIIGFLAAWCMARFALPEGQRALYLDSVGFAFPIAWMFGRLGCSIAHDHMGQESNAWFALRTPQGGRLDLGLIELVFTVAVAGLFISLNRRGYGAARGYFFTALILALYGPFRFWLETLRRPDEQLPSEFAFAALLGAAGLGLSFIGRRRGAG